MSNNKQRDLYNDKVEISVLALIEIKRAFSALLNNKESYIYNVFSDDFVFIALDELKKTYAEYFDEEVKQWGDTAAKCQHITESVKKQKI